MKSDYSSFPPIGVAAYSDFYTVPEPKGWGDFWLKENLLKEFKASGYPVDNSSPKVLLHLFGEPLENIPRGTYPVLWIHSHPDWVTKEIIGKYRKIYCISPYFTDKIRASGFDAGPLMVPTNMTPLRVGKKYDIVFVGNTKQGKVRKVISDMGDLPYNIKIWGWGWKGLIPERWYGGEYYENSGLNELYSSSKIILNDHHEDMRREGFINPRVLDALASGGFVISDSVYGMDKVLGGGVVTYGSPEDLRAKINRYIDNDEERESISKKGRKIAEGFTYAGACRVIISHIESVFGTSKL